MDKFISEARKIMESIEVLAQAVEKDANVEEYLCEMYGGLDFIPLVMEYIKEHIARTNGENRIASADCCEIKIILCCGKHHGGYLRGWFDSDAGLQRRYAP